MHSPFDLRGRGGVLARLLLGLLLVATMALAVLTRAAAPDPRPGAAAEPLAVSTWIARAATAYEVSRSFVGRVEAARRARVGFEIGGRVEVIHVDEGDRVGAGDVLARIDTARLQARRRELAAALAHTRADLALARRTRERVADALSFKGASEQEADEAGQRVAALEAAEHLAQARIDSVDVDLAKGRIVAPFAAVVTARLVDEGEVVAAGHPLLDLVEDAPVEIRVPVAGESAGRVQPGAVVAVSIGMQRVEARVRAVLPVRDPGTRTLDLLLDPIAPSAPLRPGDTVRVDIALTLEGAGFWLPLGALTEDPRGLWAVLVAGRQDGPDTTRVERRLVEVVYQSAAQAYVRGTLQAGDRVVASGGHRIVPGQQVRVHDVTTAAPQDRYVDK
ncbi:MAG: efflux RND transporter periplasmic adaptor subunit [Gammaproteobacteria bacterium]|nr:efflux RND transporter periplasmic adaptor subunit [Gammaproteobacteria bacterium]